MPNAGPRQSSISVWTAGEPLVKGQGVYSSAANTVKIAKANDLATKKVVGVVFRSAAQGGRVLVIHIGEIRGLSGLEPLSDLWLQDDGFLSHTPVPAGPGRFTLRMGFAKSAEALIVQIGEPKIRA